MNTAPFFIGFVLIVPSVNIFASGAKRSVLHGVKGHGVGALLYSEQAILHESIKEDIQHEVSVYWVRGVADADPVSRLAVDMIMCNTRFISIANAWYRVSQGKVASPLAGELLPGVLERDLFRWPAINAHLPGSVLSGQDGQSADRQPVDVLCAGLSGQVGGGVLVTLFGEETGILASPREGRSPDMAIVVDRYVEVRAPGFLAHGNLLRVVAG